MSLAPLAGRFVQNWHGECTIEGVDRLEGRVVRRIPVSAVRERFGEVLRHVAVRREWIILTRHGHALGAIVPMEDVERLRVLDGEANGARLDPYRSSWRRITDSIHARRVR